MKTTVKAPVGKDLALLSVRAALEKKATNSLIYEVSKRCTFTDYFLISSGSNEKQVQAIADEIVSLAKKNGVQSPKVEGYEEGRWVLIDFTDVVVHVFHDYIREFYDLESLWNESPRVSIPAEYYSSSMATELSSGSTGISLSEGSSPHA